MTKMFEVELKYVSYSIIKVEADNQEEAESIAWQEIDSDGSYRDWRGEWSLVSTEEIATE